MSLICTEILLLSKISNYDLCNLETIPVFGSFDLTTMMLMGEVCYWYLYCYPKREKDLMSESVTPIKDLNVKKHTTYYRHLLCRTIV